MEGRDLRKEIIEAARGLFIAHGYRGLSMREIAVAVGVSKPALYYHFKDKEELFLAILTAYLEELSELLEKNGRGVDGCRERVRGIVSDILHQPCEQRALIRLGSQEVGHLSVKAQEAFYKVYYEQFIGKLENILKTGMERGELRRMDASVATWALLGIIYPYLYPTEMHDEPLLDETIDGLLSIYFEGVEINN